MLEILTPIVKLHRVSRSVDPTTFEAAPGIWGVLMGDGSLVNVTTDTPSKLNKLVVNSASSNKYESNDVEVGRLTTIEDIGVRVLVDDAGFTTGGGLAQGEALAVSVKAGYEGKLFGVDENPNSEGPGDFEIVARIEEVDAVSGTIVYKTVAPSYVPLT
jgi:hypothetical protein